MTAHSIALTVHVVVQCGAVCMIAWAALWR